MSVPLDTLGARPPCTVTVDPDRVVAYAAATNDDNPAYLSGKYAPPVFGVVPAWDPLIAAVFDVVPPEKKPVMLHAGHDMRFSAAIVPGTSLCTVADRFSVRPSRAGTWVTVRAVSVDIDTGDQVLEQFGTMFVRGWSDVDAFGPDRPDHSFRSAGRAEPVAVFADTVDADQTWRYAAASGDDNRIHIDDEFARGVGLPGIILHGLCTMAMCSRAVIESVAGGDPTRLARLAVRFSRPVVPGSDLVTTIYPGAEGDGSFAFEASSGGERVIRDGWGGAQVGVVPTLRLFASAREAAGTARAEIDADTVAELLAEARRRFGDRFGQVLDTSRVWVNGQPAEMTTAISGHDVVAVLPPVSGGSAPPAAAPVRRPPSPEPPPTTRVSPTPGPSTPVSPAPVSATPTPVPPSASPGPAAPVPSPPGPSAGPPATPDKSEPARPSEASRLAKPPRRLHLVPPPPPDGHSGESRQGAASAPVHSGSRPAGASAVGRLALAPATLPDEAPALPQSAPLAHPGIAPFPAPEAEPSPSPELAAAVPDVVPVPVPASVTDPKPTTPLAVVHHSTRPHGRLGVAWAIVTTGLLVAGPGWLSAWMAAIAFVAASQAANVWRKRGERPLPGFAAAAAAAIPLTAASGLDHMNMVVAGAIVLTLVARVASPTKAPGRDVALTLVIGLSIGMAAAAPVLLRSINIPSALYLLACAALYDAGAYLVGTGASSAWEGPAAGVAALIPLTMLAAVVLVPPFHGGTPLLLGLLAAVLAPFGPVAGSALLGDRTAYAPALRRLDSLLILGPIWAWCAAALLV